MWNTTGIVLALGFGTVLIKLIPRLLEKYWGTSVRSNEESVEDKVVVITGSNTGIGKATALEMAARGAIVILACRNMDAATKAIRDIQEKIPTGRLVPMILDLGSFDSICEFVQRFKTHYSKLHILINNAGIFSPMSQKIKSKDGLEIHFAVNHLGHFLLTNLLLDTIKKSAPSRIVTVGSQLYCNGTLNWDDIMFDSDDPGSETIINHPLYANSKLANALFSKELARRLEGTGVNTYCLCPGLVATDITRTMNIPWYFQIFKPLVSIIRKTPQQGCQTILHCALSKDVVNQSGEMYLNCSFWDPKSRRTLTIDDAEKLWVLSENLTSLHSKMKEVDK